MAVVDGHQEGDSLFSELAGERLFRNAAAGLRNDRLLQLVAVGLLLEFGSEVCRLRQFGHALALC